MENNNNIYKYTLNAKAIYFYFNIWEPCLRFNMLYIEHYGRAPWLQLPAWKVGIEPHSGLPVSKKQNVSSPRTRNDSIQ